MAAVIPLRPQLFEPERPDEQVEFAAPKPAPEGRRWPFFVSVLFAIGVSSALWAAIIWIAAAIF